jgi:hypothetical protein
MRRAICTVVTIGLLALVLAAGVSCLAQPNFAKVKEYRIERSIPPRPRPASNATR